MARPGAQFSFEELSTSLRTQASQAELLRRFASSGDVVPWTAGMGAATTAPPGWAGITGFYVRTKDSVLATFTVTQLQDGGHRATASIPMPMSLARLVNPNDWVLRTSAEAQANASPPIEVALVLDNTGSMSADMPALRSAA